jgi:Mce-associated membrane protein
VIGGEERDEIVAAITGSTGRPRSDEETAPADADAASDYADEASLDVQRSRLTGPVLLGVVVVLTVALVVVTSLVHGERSADDRSDAALKEIGTSLTRLLSWKSRTVEAELDDELKLLHGDFADEYEGLVRKTIAPAARQSRLDASAEIVAAGVVDQNDDGQMVLLYFVNVKVSPSGRRDELTPLPPRPLGDEMGSRIEVTVVEVDGKFLIEGYKPV